MTSTGSNGLLFINLSNKTASPSKSLPATVLAHASQPLPLTVPHAHVPVVPVHRYSQSIAAAAACSNISPKRARGDPTPPPLYFPRQSKIYPVMASPPFSVTVASPAVAAQVPVAEAAAASAQAACEYEVALPSVQAVVTETASVSTRCGPRSASLLIPLPPPQPPPPLSLSSPHPPATGGTAA